MSKKAMAFYTLFLFFLLAVGTYLHVQDVRAKHNSEPLAKETKCPYKNVNPNRCEPNTAVKKKEYVVLRNELVEYIETQKKEKKLINAAVYFRDLQNGPIVNINEQDAFIPASLLKLPLLITYYKKAETDPALLSQNIVVGGDLKIWEQNVIPGKSAQVGETYTIDALLTLLITESDNISWKVLLNYLRDRYSEEDFIDTLSDLGIVDPRKRNDQQYINAQSYASLFRILYNSSYLSTQMSDKALGLLKRSSFKEGIVAGVPEGIQIAHKFGEQSNGSEQQFHDCGIVYYPNNPYVICVMTEGKSLEELKPIIKEISHMVYEEVQFRNTN